jgi:hypothetical protein
MKLKTFILMAVMTAGMNVQAQNQEERNAKIISLLQEEHKNLNHYEQTPMYYLQVDKQSCRVLIDIDDIILGTQFTEDYGETMLIPINGYLRCSGKHKCNIKVLPTSKENTISEKAWVNVKVLYLENKTDALSDAKEIGELLSLPQDISKMNRQEIDLSTSFNVTLPYDYSNILSTAKDLRDVPNLEQKVIAYYNKIHSWIKNCDLYSKLYARKDLWILGDMYYLTDKNIFFAATIGEEDIYDHTLIDREVLPIENYEMIICGNGRLVQLRRKKYYDTVLKVKYFESENDKKKNTETYSETTIMLYMPNGSDEFKMFY